MKKKVSLNEDNQLILKPSKNSNPKTITGRIKVDRNNSLIFLVNKPSRWKQEFDNPERLEFSGKWGLNRDQDLVFNIKEDKRFKDGKLVFKSKVLGAEGDALIFKIKQKVTSKKEKISLLKLRGRWQADKFNRLSFYVSRKKETDVLSFKGAWEINKNKQIVYKYDKLKTKSNETFILKGFWKILSKNKLGYELEKAKERPLEFRAYLQTPNIYPAQGKIKYRIGVGLKNYWKERELVLFGRWKFSRKFGLVWEADFGNGKVKRIKFQAELKVRSKDSLVLKLKSERGQSLGITLTYTRRMLPKKDFEYFLEAGREHGGAVVKVGGKLSF